jgi:hypothetical protein
MMVNKVFRDYHVAYEHARVTANELSMSVGIERSKDSYHGRVFHTFLLPKPENRSGLELRAECVDPGSPRFD